MGIDHHDDASAGDGLGLGSLAFDSSALVNGSGDTAFDAAELLSSTASSTSSSTSSSTTTSSSTKTSSSTSSLTPPSRPASVSTPDAFYGGDDIRRFFYFFFCAPCSPDVLSYTGTI